MAALKKYLKGPALALIMGIGIPILVLLINGLAAASLAMFCTIRNGSPYAVTCSAHGWMQSAVENIVMVMFWGPALFGLSIIVALAAFILTINDRLRARSRNTADSNMS